MATAAALTVSTNNLYMNPAEDRIKGSPCEITLDWLSTDLGVVSIAIFATYNTAVAAGTSRYPNVSAIKGRISKVETIPGTLGVPATNPPTNLYDITLLDAYGYDVMDGTLADRSATVAEVVVFDSPINVNGELTLTIANAGNANNGRMIITLVE